MRLKTSHGRSIRVIIPPSVATLAPTLHAEEAKLRTLEEQLEARRDELTKLRSDLEQAELERGEKVAAAALEGKPLPKADPTKPIREAIDLAESHVGGLETAIEQQTERIVGVLDRDRDEFIDAAVARRSEAERELSAALDALLSTRAKLVAAVETIPPTWAS
jgi:DNA repair exonuclease SbcCD ATPase subunit